MPESSFDHFDQLTSEQRTKINEVVRQLEEQYKTNTELQSVESLLEQASDSLRPQLLYELLREELAILAKKGVVGDESLIVERFPQFKQAAIAAVHDHRINSTSLDVESLVANPERVDGIRFGKFELVKLVGHGTFGAVFEAHDTLIKRRVALKIPRTSFLIDMTGTSQFVEEAKNAAALHHQNIVPVFEAGFEGPDFYIASQFVDGRSLRQIIKHPLPKMSAAMFARAIASAIAHAHQHGVVHNDVKPDNVLLDKNDIPLLTDFGLSKLTTSKLKLPSGGSLAYTAPERLGEDDGSSDPRSDIWSLGVFLFEMLTGNRPFVGSARQIQNQISNHSQFSAAELGDKDLLSICNKCVSVNLSQRYQNAKQLEVDLGKYCDGLPVSTRRLSGMERFSKWTRRSPWVAGLSTLVFFSLLTIGIGSALYANWMSKRANELLLANEQVTNSLLAETESKRKTLRLNYAGSMYEALDRFNDQRYYKCLDKLASLRTMADAEDLRGIEWHILHKLASSEAEKFPVQTSPIADADISPDGKMIATVARDGTLMIQDTNDGSLIKRINTGRYPVEGVAFTNDSDRLLTVSYTLGLQEWDVETGKRLRHKAFPGGAFVNLAISPNQDWIAVSNADTIRICDYSTLEIKHEMKHGSSIRRLVFSADGMLLVSCGVNAKTGVWSSLSGELVLELGGHSRAVHDASFSPDGASLLTASWDSTICVWDTADWSIQKQLEEFAGILRAVQYSPNGKTFAAAGEDKSVKVWDSKTYQLISKFDQHDFMIEHLEFSPDGNMLFSVEFGGVTHIGDLFTSNIPRVRGWELKSNENVFPSFSFESRFNPVCTFDDAWPQIMVELSKANQVATLFNLGKQSEETYSRIALLDSTTGEVTVQRVFRSDFFQEFGKSPTRDVFVAGSRNKLVVLDNSLNEVASMTPGEQELFQDVEFLTNETIAILSIAATSKVQSWNWRTGELKLLFKFDEKLIGMAATKSGNFAFSTKNGISFYNLSTNDTVEFEIPMPVGDIYFSPNEQFLIAHAGNRGVVVWELPKGISMVLDSHDETITSFGFSPDSTRIVTCGDDGHVKIWDPETGSELLDFGNFPGQLRAMCFVENGTRILLGTNDWDGGRNGAIFELKK